MPNLSDQLSNFCENRGMQSGKTKFHKFFIILVLASRKTLFITSLRKKKEKKERKKEAQNLPAEVKKSNLV